MSKKFLLLLKTFFSKKTGDTVSLEALRVRQEVMDHLDSYIYVIQPDTFEVLFMNDKIRNLMNAIPSNTPCYAFFRGNREPCEDCPMRKLNESATSKVTCEIYNDKLNIWLETTISTLHWIDGTKAYLLNCDDITEQKEEQLQHIKQLESIAYVDEMTGGRTYYKFKEDAQHILEEQKDTAHFIIKLDIDNFKLINQIYGYETGDEILRCMAAALAQVTRDRHEIFARVRSDEFIALFTLREDDDPQKIFEGFLHRFHELVGEGFSFKCNFPNGRYIVHPEDAEKQDILDMFEKVNIAHKVAKLDKTLDFVVYDEKMRRDALRQKEIENKMESGLMNHEFQVYLQPKYLLDDGAIGGAEALARWNNENEDLFMPSAFIAAFEKNGFITKLDKYMLDQVCGIIKDWIAEGIEPVTVSVNFSRLHLSNLNFVQELCEIVDRYSIDHKYIEIEITETVIYDNIDKLEGVLSALHAAGFTMSMDDFGSGCSSLGMLQNLPVDIIKMDHSFFAGQQDIRRSNIVVASVVHMSGELGIRVVAEGVEERNQIDFLRAIHCDMAQGYYFARPMPEESFRKLVS
ncbi:MAG: GGDEF domain-containing phosphodiesterase [Clostridium sp.]